MAFILAEIEILENWNKYIQEYKLFKDLKGVFRISKFLKYFYINNNDLKHSVNLYFYIKQSSK